jgi:hypothetical protein
MSFPDLANRNATRMSADRDYPMVVFSGPAIWM